MPTYNVTGMCAALSDGKLRAGMESSGDVRRLSFEKTEHFGSWVEDEPRNRESLHRILDAWIDGVEYW